MTDDYISREAVLAEYDRQHQGPPGGARKIIAEFPAADVRPVVHGKWKYDHWCEFKCSECGYYSKSEPYRGLEKFCPNCGADMRQKEDVE